MNISIPDGYVEQGSIPELKRLVGIDADSVTERVLAAYRKGSLA